MIDEGHYFRRSWALLTRDRGWIKPVLVLAAARLVPIVGRLGTYGYAMEWARLTAWGVDAAPKQKNVQVGTCIASGWRGFVASIVPILAVSLINMLGASALSSIDAPSGLISLYSIIFMIVGLLASTIALVCSLHATIYQDFKAGFSFGRIAAMLKGNFSGIARITALYFVMNFIVGFVIGIVIVMTLMAALVPFASQYAMWAYSDVISQLTTSDVLISLADLLSGLAAAAPVVAILVILGEVATVIVELVICQATGLWMRQFDVPRWGKSSEPLPQVATRL